MDKPQEVEKKIAQYQNRQNTGLGRTGLSDAGPFWRPFSPLLSVWRVRKSKRS